MRINLIERVLGKKLKENTNKSVLELFINNETDLYDNYSAFSGTDPVNNSNVKINKNIIDYLKTETSNIPVKNALAISVKSSDKLHYDIGFIEKIIKDYVKKEMTIISARIKRMNITSFFLATVGMLLIALTQIFPIVEKRYALNEFIIVMSWVFMWKAVDLIFFDRPKLMKEKGILIKIFYSDLV